MPLNISTGRSLLYNPPTAAVGGVSFTITATATKIDTVGGSPVTYNSGGNPSIGTADANRVVVVAIAARLGATASVASVSIGGNAASQVPGAAGSNAAQNCSDLWYLAVPTGTTAAISVTYNGSTLESAIEVYSVITSTPTPSGGNSSASASVTSRSAALAIPSGGGLIGVLSLLANPGAPSLTWSGGTFTEDADQSTGGSRHFGAAHDTTDAGTTPTVTCTYSGAASNMSLSVAAWGP